MQQLPLKSTVEPSLSGVWGAGAEMLEGTTRVSVKCGSEAKAGEVWTRAGRHMDGITTRSPLGRAPLVAAGGPQRPNQVGGPCQPSRRSSLAGLLRWQERKWNGNPKGLERAAASTDGPGMQ